jgi:hypothetical protein
MKDCVFVEIECTLCDKKYLDCTLLLYLLYLAAIPFCLFHSESFVTRTVGSLYRSLVFWTLQAQSTFFNWLLSSDHFCWVWKQKNSSLCVSSRGQRVKENRHVISDLKFFFRQIRPNQNIFVVEKQPPLHHISECFCLTSYCKHCITSV